MKKFFNKSLILCAFFTLWVGVISSADARTEVSSFSELATAVADGETDIVLTSDITITSALNYVAGTVIDGQHLYSIHYDASSFSSHFKVVPDGKQITFKDIKNIEAHNTAAPSFSRFANDMRGDIIAEKISGHHFTDNQKLGDAQNGGGFISAFTGNLYVGEVSDNTLEIIDHKRGPQGYGGFMSGLLNGSTVIIDEAYGNGVILRQASYENFLHGGVFNTYRDATISISNAHDNFAKTQTTSALSRALGAVIFHDTATLTLKNSSFTDNYAEAISTSGTTKAEGGAFGIYDNGILIFDNNEDYLPVYSGNYVLAKTTGQAYARGGAIYVGCDGCSGEKGKIENTITGRFEGNKAIATHNVGTSSSSVHQALGGAIYNIGTVADIEADFIGNEVQAGVKTDDPKVTSNYNGSNAAYGGAIYNSSTMGNISGLFQDNKVFSSSYNARTVGSYGGAIYNSGTIGDINADFVGNSVAYEGYSNGGTARGGAIYNTSDGVIGDISGTFKDNVAYLGPYLKTETTGTHLEKNLYSGAIFSEGQIGNVDAVFIGNKVIAEHGNNKGQNFDGRLMTDANVYIHQPSTPIEKFYAVFGTREEGTGNQLIQTGEELGNVAANGVAFRIKADVNDMVISAVNNTAYSNSNGGRMNYDGGVGVIEGDVTINMRDSEFIDNIMTIEKRNATTSNDLADSQGGLELRSGNVSIKNSVFDGNQINISSDNGTYLEATGAGLYNGSQLILENVSFENNTANVETAENTSDMSKALGGALYNKGTVTVKSVVFKNNGATATYGTANGGAIYNISEMNFDADGDETRFEVNYVSSMVDGETEVEYEAIYNKGTINFASDNDGKYTFYDSINGDENGFISFSATDDKGSLNLYNDMKGQNEINFNSNYVINMQSPDDRLAKEALSVVRAKNININSVLQMQLDVDLARVVMDHFEADTFTIGDDNKITVTDIRILSDGAEDETRVPFIVADSRNNVTNETVETIEKAASANDEFYYKVTFDETDGSVVFEKTDEPVHPDPWPLPEVVADSIAHASAQIAVENLNSVIVNREINKNLLSYRGLSSGEASILTTWAELFGSDNDVKMKNGKGSIQTKFYGVVGGIDSKLFRYRNGFEAIYGIYASYTRSNQKSKGVEITQDGLYLGLSSEFYNGIMFSNLSLNGGYLKNEADSKNGKDQFDSKMVSVSNKTGVNIERCFTTVTPSLYLSYMGIDTEDYTTKGGTDVGNAFTHVFTVSPEIKISEDYGSGLDGYIKVAYKMFFYANNKIKADGVLLPEMSVKPYVEYGVGLKKDWNEDGYNSTDATSYAEVSRHDGGREGWDVNLGLKLDF